jgi:alkaline phosphatase
MKHKQTHVRLGMTALMFGAALAFPQLTHAVPTVSRLTPPSALFDNNDPDPPFISRFLPGQRFDLQATVSPDMGQSIMSVQFYVDGVLVPGNVWLVTSGIVPSKPAGTTVASLRAYANLAPGVHVLSVVAQQTDTQTVTKHGNFEVIPLKPTGLAAKNIIILIGDGMGVATRAATRIMLHGVSQGKATKPLAMDTLPFTALVSTHSLNSICTDSSPGASCYATGNKANNNQHGVFPDDTTAVGDNPRVESMGEYLHRTQGRALGVVTTTDLFDSTPGAFISHTQSRTFGAGILDQSFDEKELTGLTVLMGGGRKWFLPAATIGSGRSTATDYAMSADEATAWGVPTGAIDPGRDLLADYINAGFTYVPDATSLNAIPSTTPKLLGLFQLSNMNVAKDKIDGRRNHAGVVYDYGFPDQPMLDEMTDKALSVLSQYTNGFVLMVEGGSIDKQQHLMDTERWVIDMIEFDKAIARCQAFADKRPDTLVIVTADHECGGSAVIGGSKLTHAGLVTEVNAAAPGTNSLRHQVVGTLESAGFPYYPIAADGYPTTTDIDFRMIIAYACNADRFEDYLTHPYPIQNASHGITTTPPFPGYPQSPVQRDNAHGYFFPGHIPDAIATHTASDIVLSASGRNAGTFTGVMDNTDVFFRVMRVAFGDNSLWRETKRQLGRGRVPIRDDVPSENASDGEGN